VTVTFLLVNLALAALAVIVLDGVNELATHLRRDDESGGEGGGGWRWRRRPHDPRGGRPALGSRRSPTRGARSPRPRARR
jgi:hypothetical protein